MIAVAAPLVAAMPAGAAAVVGAAAEAEAEQAEENCGAERNAWKVHDSAPGSAPTGRPRHVPASGGDVPRRAAVPARHSRRTGRRSPSFRIHGGRRVWHQSGMAFE